MEYAAHVFAFIDRHRMIESDDEVVLGLSGGADSVALFFVLRAYAASRNIPFTLRAVHVNHGLRGEEAQRDAAFCRSLCEREGVSFQEIAVHVRDEVNKTGETTEEAARRLRYEALRAAFSDGHTGGRKLAVAHHIGDQAETVLFRLARGTGVRGISGMLPVAGDVIRPLLCVTRAETEDYLRGLGQIYVTDSTNEDDAYSRNRIRRQVIPQLLAVNPGAARHIAAVASELAEVTDYLDKQAGTAYSDIVSELPDGDLRVDEARLMETDIALHPLILEKALHALSGSAKDISRTHIDALLGGFALQTGRAISLPYGVTAYRISGGMRLRKARQTVSQGVDASDFSIEILDFCTKIPKKDYTKYLDYDKITNGVSFRTRSEGDYLTLDGAGHRKMLARYFIDEKVDRVLRDKVPLVCDGSHVMWVVGYRISAYYRVTEETKRIACIKYLRRE